MFPSQPEELQPKPLLLLPAAGLSVRPSFLMNGHWLLKRNSLTWQRCSISFSLISVPPHTHNTPTHPSTLFLLQAPPSSSSLCLPRSVLIPPLPPPFTLFIAPSFVFISLIYFLCQMQADSHQSFSIPPALSLSLSHTHTHVHTR